MSPCRIKKFFDSAYFHLALGGNMQTKGSAKPKTPILLNQDQGLLD